MAVSLFEKPAFRPFAGAFLLIFAALWVYGWAAGGAVRQAWDKADNAVFFALNGSLADRPVWQGIWAVGNHLSADILMGLCIGLLFYRFAAADGRRFVMERLCVFLLLGVVTVGAKLALRLLDEYKRVSASLTLEPAIHLTDHVTWITTKDISYDCFPSDHGNLLLIAVACLWFFGGRRFGLPMLGLAVLFSLPRLFSGAHWFTDMAVGSVAVALAVSAITFCTPLYRWVIRGLLRLFDRPCFTRFLPLIGLAPQN